MTQSAVCATEVRFSWYVVAPNNASVRATPTPKQQSWWTIYAAQLGCEAVQTVDKGEEIVTAYGLSILAGGGAAYKTAGAFFAAGASLQLGIREECGISGHDTYSPA